MSSCKPRQFNRREGAGHGREPGRLRPAGVVGYSGSDNGSRLPRGWRLLMLTVWGRKSSSNVQAVMWCIGELGLAYRRHDVGHSYGGNDTPAFLAMNPNGTIPVLRDGDGPPLWESAAILRYLCGRYAPAWFWPPDPSARAEVDMWAEWAKINV